MKKEIGHVCFQVHGDFLTEHCRSLVLEDNWIHAIKTLQEGLVGMAVEHVYSILKGDAKLEGVNSLELLKDDDKKYKKELDWKYAGIVKEGSKFYRPYAVVTSYGIDDASYAYRTTGISESSKASRSLFYANNSDDISKLLSYEGSKMYTLFKEVTSIPVWIAVAFNQGENDRWQKSLDESLKHRRIDVRGWKQENPEIDIDRQELLDKARKTAVDRMEKIKKVFPDLNGRNTAFDMAEKDTQEEKLSDYRDDEFKRNEYAWILTDGEVYSCQYAQHKYIAELIITQKYGLPDSTSLWNAERELELRNAVKVGSAMMVGHYIFYEDASKVTQSQVNKIYDWCVKVGYKFPDDLTR